LNPKIATIFNLPALLKWGKLLSFTGGAQLLIQGIGFVSGIFIIRMLSTDEYAYYTLANTMLGTMAVLADGGITTGVLSQGGTNWQDRQHLGATLATGMKLRQEFAVGSLLVSIPILFYLLHEQGLVWWQSLILIVCITPTFFAALSASLLQIIPRLHQDIKPLMGINISVNIIRLVLLPVLLLYPLAWIAILATGIGQVIGNFKLRKLALKYADWKQQQDPDLRKKILQTVKRILPGSIYYCISGQITVWLIAIFSTTESIAQIGALARLMMLLTLLRFCVDMVIVPRYARLKSDSKLIVSRFFQVLGIVVVISVGISGFVYLFPEECLWVLGKKYQGLQHEVFLMTISSCLVLLNGVAHKMSSSRAIIPNPYFFIGTIIVTQALTLAFLVDYTSVSGVIMFSIYTSLVTLSYRTAHFLLEVSRKGHE